MTISVDWANTKVIDVELTDLTFDRVEPISGRSIYTFDTDAFRLELRTLEAAQDEGRPWPQTHKHGTEATLSGTIYARLFQIIAPYTVRFEDGQYGVELDGSNNNLLDVTVVNQVSVRPNNSAGLIVTERVSGLTTQEAADLLLARELMEADEFYDQSAGLLHYYRRGTTDDLIPPKTVTGATASNDTSAQE